MKIKLLKNANKHTTTFKDNFVFEDERLYKVVYGISCVRYSQIVSI